MPNICSWVKTIDNLVYFSLKQSHKYSTTMLFLGQHIQCVKMVRSIYSSNAVTAVPGGLAVASHYPRSITIFNWEGQAIKTISEDKLQLSRNDKYYTIDWGSEKLYLAVGDYEGINAIHAYKVCKCFNIIL